MTRGPAPQGQEGDGDRDRCAGLRHTPEELGDPLLNLSRLPPQDRSLPRGLPSRMQCNPRSSSAPSPPSAVRISYHTPCSRATSTIGSHSVKVLPFASPSDSAQIRPPCSSTSRLVNASPKPAPSCR